MDWNTSLEQQHLHHPCPAQKPILNSSLLNMETGEGHEGSHVLGHGQGLHYIPFYYSQLHLPNNPVLFIDHKSSPNTSSNSNNNNINDSGEGNVVADERKKKRMFSNRESARRSRMRKKQQIENLQYQVDHLQTMNHQLSQKIIYLLECNQQILQQNGQLKDKITTLQMTLSDLLVPLPRDDEANNHITNALIAEPSAPPVASSEA
ncbi:hypothetical protein QN277_014551 [Acacia crassicarpa]|uniref:BZIP domain-containing protein n=1 Tax=Acacia crassicarpa TaxID=499986 RepID=A0AAE1IKT6_9FABA|nr:hypothetical protein QN277_014551 [Acacia crassicarpa]